MVVVFRKTVMITEILKAFAENEWQRCLSSKEQKYCMSKFFSQNYYIHAHTYVGYYSKLVVCHRNNRMICFRKASFKN